MIYLLFFCLLLSRHILEVDVELDALVVEEGKRTIFDNELDST